jgi:predicted N-formylglutamate amidohydrolase
VTGDDQLRSIPGLCEIEYFGSPGTSPGAPPDLLVELPHGATTLAHLENLAGKLSSRLPPDLKEFFFVNTDVGTPECAREVGRRFPGRTLVLRCLLPRTLVDCNRALDPTSSPRPGMTPAIPEYVDVEEDVRLLRVLYDDYQQIATRAFESVCGAGGAALLLHSYAPRSVKIDRIDREIVTQLREAYRPERYESWPLRPEVDVIGESDAGEPLASPAVVEGIRRAYEAIGVHAEANATYRLHDETTGYRHAVRHREQVVCVEIRRDLLAEPFTPFSEMHIDAAKSSRMAAPLASALSSAVER